MSNSPETPSALSQAVDKANVSGFTIPPEWQEWLSQQTWEKVSDQDFNKLSKDEQLTRIRHSASHVLAGAIRDIRPEVSFATGPATPQGFFYDMKVSEPLKMEDLETIQALVDKICAKSLPFEVASVPRQKALEFFNAIGQTHKLEIMARIASDTVTLYKHGNFIDLCAGPHVPHTGMCRNNKILNLSGTHWRGEEVPTLTRVTGTAWLKPKDLERYLEFLEASKARDHRNLGPQLDLFSFHPWAASAMWHPNGLTLRQQLMALWREQINDRDYVEIQNPLLYRKELFECSGHWQHFQENMFIFEGKTEEDPVFALKPMNCPDTMLFFRSQTRSYRDLPLRVAEGQILHRNEVTGALHGLMRTRSFVQDDAHIFLSADHVQEEVLSLLKMVDETYSLFDLTYNIHFSTRPENYMGEAAVWDEAEAGLKAALESTGKPFVIDAGEGAFYGPKVDIYIQDSLGREWQCGTVQLDFQLPERFELKYVAQDGSFQRPIVIHRAIFGSFERFMGILIEHLGGAFPTWLAPVQAVVLPIGEKQLEYAQHVLKTLKKEGFRVTLADTDSVNYRVRQAEMQKIPYMLVVGDREIEAHAVSVRRYHTGEKKTIPLDELVSELKTKTQKRVLDVEIQRYSDLFLKGSEAVSTESADY